MTIINVRLDHIHNGFRKNARNCPIALAIKEVVGLVASVSLSYRDHIAWVRLGSHQDPEAIPLPQVAVNFALSFDDSQPVEPFSFILPI